MVRDPGRMPDGVARRPAATCLDPASLRARCARCAPDELYHLAAPTFVPASWEDPAADDGGDRRRDRRRCWSRRARGRPAARVFVATSSEIFGDAGESPQNERSPMRPRSPYGVAKLAAHGLVGVAARAPRAATSSAASPTTTSRRAGPSASCRARSRAAPRRSRSACRTSWRSATVDAVRDWCTRADVVRGAWLVAAGRRARRLRPRLAASGARSATSSTPRSRGAGRRPSAASCASTRSSSARPRRRRRSATRRTRATRPRLGAGDRLRGDDRGDGRRRPRRPARARA